MGAARRVICATVREENTSYPGIEGPSGFLRRNERNIVVVFVLCLSLWTAFGETQESFRFTVTADARSEHGRYGDVLSAMNSLVGGQGVFQISPGDMDGGLWDNRAEVDLQMGPDAIWIPVVGNHEAEDAAEMQWIRTEFLTGNDVRAPLQNLVVRSGPEGSADTTYSWDQGNAHFVALNQYWDGSTEPGSDRAADGDVVPELLAWLEDDLRANTRPAVFVFGHEPAFPAHRHLDDSLNQYEANRDAFWDLLGEQSVTAYVCGHTHVFAASIPTASGVWQIDVGNAGVDSSFADGQTFLSVTIDRTEIHFVACRNTDGSFACDTSWTVPIPIIHKDGFETGGVEGW